MPIPAPKPVPDGMNTLTTHLWFSGRCGQAVEFYQKALGAELVGPVVPSSDGQGVMHAMLKLGNSHFMVADAFPDSWEKGPETCATAGLFVYVEDCDALFHQATAAGCEVMQPLADMFWGDRLGKVKDPYGHCWMIATHKYVFTPEELEQKQREWPAKSAT